MKRRHLVGTALGLAGTALGVQGQTPRAAGRIGYLHQRTVAPNHSTLGILRAAWQRLGYIEGRDVLLRSADGAIERVPSLVDELIRLQAGVLIVVGGEAVLAASRTTRTTPIVAIDLETDPVGAGLAASFARPGGNLTGLFLDQASLAGKWIELLREAVPGMDRLGLLWDPGTGRGQLEVARAAAKARGLETVVIEMNAASNFDRALQALGSRGRTGLVFLTSPGFSPSYERFVAAINRLRLPAIGFQKQLTRAGGLMSYGPVQDAYYPRAVVLADKILRGERAGDLPIEQPTQFEFVVNAKAARSLGLTLPQSLLLRADEVIE